MEKQKQKNTKQEMGVLLTLLESVTNKNWRKLKRLAQSLAFLNKS